MSKKALAVIIGLIVGFICLLLIEAIIALLITWALNSFTQLHPTFWTTFVVLIIVSLVLGGGGTVSRRR